MAWKASSDFHQRPGLSSLFLPEKNMNSGFSYNTQFIDIANEKKVPAKAPSSSSYDLNTRIMDILSHHKPSITSDCLKIHLCNDYFLYVI